MSALTPDEARDLCARIESLHGGADKVPPTIAQMIGAVRGFASDVERLTGQIDVVRAERDEARRDLDMLRSVLKPSARLGAMGAARVEADLEVYRKEEALLDAAILLRSQWPESGCIVEPPCGACAWCGFDAALDNLTEAKRAAAKIGGGS